VTRRRHEAGGAVAAGGDSRGPGGSGSRIHEGLVGARALVGTRYLADPALRAEYEREIAPRTVSALAKVLREQYPAVSETRRPERILDLGAGTGAVRDALRRHFGTGPTIVEVDRVATSPGVRVADVSNPDSLGAVSGAGRFDLVLAAHVLNELFVDDAPPRRVDRLSQLVQRWCGRLLATEGTLVLLEPALRETSRVLLAVRDQLLAAGLYIAAPCFFTGPCPALRQERDWCHDSTNAQSGRRIDFSYLVVRTSGEAASVPNLFRIVSDPLPEKGRLRLFACGLAGRQPVVRLNRHHSDANADLDRAVRGDVVRITRTTFASDGLRVDAATSVARVSQYR
jgi:hypothetical protein